MEIKYIRNYVNTHKLQTDKPTVIGVGLRRMIKGTTVRESKAPEQILTQKSLAGSGSDIIDICLLALANGAPIENVDAYCQEHCGCNFNTVLAVYFIMQVS